MNRNYFYKNNILEFGVTFEANKINSCYFQFRDESIKWKNGFGFYNHQFWKESGWRGYEVNSGQMFVSESFIRNLLDNIKNNIPVKLQSDFEAIENIILNPENIKSGAIIHDIKIPAESQRTYKPKFWKNRPLTKFCLTIFLIHILVVLIFSLF